MKKLIILPEELLENKMIEIAKDKGFPTKLEMGDDWRINRVPDMDKIISWTINNCQKTMSYEITWVESLEQ